MRRNCRSLQRSQHDSESVLWDQCLDGVAAAVQCGAAAALPSRHFIPVSMGVRVPYVRVLSRKVSGTKEKKNIVVNCNGRKTDKYVLGTTACFC